MIGESSHHPYSVCLHWGSAGYSAGTVVFLPVHCTNLVHVISTCTSGDTMGSGQQARHDRKVNLRLDIKCQLIVYLVVSENFQHNCTQDGYFPPRVRIIEHRPFHLQKTRRWHSEPVKQCMHSIGIVPPLAELSFVEKCVNEIFLTQILVAIIFIYFVTNNLTNRNNEETML